MYKIRKAIIDQEKHTIKIPFFQGYVSAGFPSPAEDYEDIELDLNKYLIKHPEATIFIKAQGDSMIGASIHEEDILIIDRSIEAVSGSIVVGVINGEFTLKRLIKEKGKLFLKPENPKYKPIEINEYMDFEVWGVVIYVIHRTN